MLDKMFVSNLSRHLEGGVTKLHDVYKMVQMVDTVYICLKQDFISNQLLICYGV